MIRSLAGLSFDTASGAFAACGTLDDSLEQAPENSMNIVDSNDGHAVC